MELDVRGEICPYPMLKAVEAMKKLKGTDTVILFTDHAPCLSTIPPPSREVRLHISGGRNWTG
jgi:TusA-related sulfurtransferase